MYSSATLRKNFFTGHRNSGKQSIDSRVVLPLINSKSGTLRTFLSVDDFRKPLNLLPDDLKSIEPTSRVKTRKIYITMNEELSSHTKNEPSNELDEGQDEQGEVADERKILLYDKHFINRQKAAVNICKIIVDEVKQKFGYTNANEDSEISKADSDKSEDKPGLDVKKLINDTKECATLIEKLQKISNITQEYFSRPQDVKKKLLFKNELVPGDFEETVSHESNLHRISKSKDKMLRDETYTQNGDFSELFPEIPRFSAAHQKTYKKIIQSIPKIVCVNSPSSCYSILLQKVELGSPSGRINRQKRTYVVLNRNCISLPNLRLDSMLIIYITEYFTAWRSLLKVDVSNNNIGDKSIALLVLSLCNFSEAIENLDVSFTQCAELSAKAVHEMLTSRQLRLQHLRIEGNPLRDEGVCLICVGLLVNSSLIFLNISDTQIESSGGIALSKVIRLNRSLKGIVMNRSEISGNSLREICRALIVNNEMRSFVAGGCGLVDSDAKELGHMLNSNGKLQQLSVIQNNFTSKGLKAFQYGISRNKSLVHLALSGNERIRLIGLENIKKSVPAYIDIDIGKEDDFFKTSEAKKLKLMEYIR